MQAVILAAGRGRRMEPYSATCHKALLEIGGTTILGRTLESLIRAGVAPITVVTGYRRDDITEFVSTHFPDAPVRYVHNERYASTNNIVSLALALNSIDYRDDVLLVECDLLFEPHLITLLAEHPAGNVALVDHYRTGMDGTVVAVEDGYVTGVFPTDRQGADFSFRDKFKTLNLYKFDRVFCATTLRPMLEAYARHVDENCYYELVLGMLAGVTAHRIRAEVVDGSDWVEVDDPNDLTVARFVHEPGERPKILDRSFGGHWSFNVLDFSLPRNAYFPSPAMVAALRHAVPEVVTGYGSCQEVLDEKAALLIGCAATRVRLLNGASQAYPLLRAAYEGHRVAIPEPTFGEYPRCFPRAVRYPEVSGDGRELDRWATATDLMVVVNPNNPSGVVVPSRRLHDLAARTPDTSFLVDESFLAFSGEPSLVTLLEQEPLPNVTVLTSLSKSLGVPGLRLGYLYTHDVDLLRRLDESLPIWGVNALAEYFLELTVKFRAELVRSIALTVAERRRLRDALRALPMVRAVPESAANFLLVELVGDDPTVASSLRRDLLATAGIEVKDVSAKYPDRRPRLRVAVRTREDNDRLVASLAAAAGS